MRLQLISGYQKRLVETAKMKNDFTWKDLSKKLNHSEGYIRKELRQEKRLISEKCYKTLCVLANENYDDKIINRRPSNWGQIKGGQNSTPLPHEPRLLVKNPSVELAELVGVILGDGNIWSKSGYYYVRIIGHSTNDKEYLLNYIRKLFKKIFGLEITVSLKPRNGMYIQAGSKDLVYTLEKYGLKPGNKKINNVGIPKWIFNSKEYLKVCIRGLIDTDGCVCPITNRNYSYIWFKSAIPQLIKDFQKALHVLGFKTGKWINPEKGTPYVSIAKKTLINKYYKEIGFKNPKHIKRFNAPVV